MRGQKALVVGVANQHGLALAVARHLHAVEADIGVTYFKERTRPQVELPAESIDAPIAIACDVTRPEDLTELFDRVRSEWGRLDVLFHSIGSVRKEDLGGRLVDCSADGFAEAMRVSCHPFIRLEREARPPMSDGGSLLTLSFYGAKRVVDHHNGGAT